MAKRYTLAARLRIHCRAKALVAAWDEDKHPREPAGSPDGGQFASGSGGDAAISSEVTKTPAFKAWFGDSKVVKPDGTPMVVYHGTTAEFSSFDTGRGLQAFYFSQSARAASNYAEARAEREGSSPSVIAAFLKVEHPKVIHENSPEWDEYSSLFEEGINKLISEGFDGVFMLRSRDVGSNPGPGDRAGDLREIAVFSPTQIKSATGNSGKFDPNDPDIRKRLRVHHRALALLERTPDWDESKHPRDEDGKWTDGGGGSTENADPVSATPAQQVIAEYQDKPVAGVTMQLFAHPTDHLYSEEVGSKTVTIVWMGRQDTALKGSGAAAMNRLCAIADKHGVILQLNVDPHSKTFLLKYYKQFGFVRFKKTLDMVRMPSKATKHSPVPKVTMPQTLIV